MIRILAGVLIATLAIAGVQSLRLSWAYQDLAEAKADYAQLKESSAKAALEAEKTVRAQENKLAAASAAVSESYEKGVADAQAVSARVVDDLRAGNLKLRQQWRGCEANRVSNAAAAAIGADEEDRHRRESAGRIVRAAAECDAQVNALQAFVRGERDALGVPQP